MEGSSLLKNQTFYVCGCSPIGGQSCLPYQSDPTSYVVSITVYIIHVHIGTIFIVQAYFRHFSIFNIPSVNS